MKYLIPIVLLLLLSGCARFDKKTTTFYGWGRYKDSDVEMESTPPLADIINVNAVKGI